MAVITPTELKRFMDENGFTVTDIVADTKIHSNTVYRFLSGKKPVLQSTELNLTRWMEERAKRNPARAASG